MYTYTYSKKNIFSLKKTVYEQAAYMYIYNCHHNYKLFMAKQNSSRQNQKRLAAKPNKLTTKPNTSQQIRKVRGRTKWLTAKAI